MAEHPQPDTKSSAWQCLAQEATGQYDQLAARKAALEAAGDHAPAMLRAGVLLETAEWVAATGAATGAAGTAGAGVSAEELLLAAVDLLAGLDHAAAGGHHMLGCSAAIIASSLGNGQLCDARHSSYFCALLTAAVDSPRPALLTG